MTPSPDTVQRLDRPSDKDKLPDTNKRFARFADMNWDKHQATLLEMGRVRGLAIAREQDMPAWRAELFIAGFAKGFAKGFKEEYETGFKTSMTKFLVPLLESRFGALSPAQLARIQTADARTIKELSSTVSRVDSLESLLGRP